MQPVKVLGEAVGIQLRAVENKSGLAVIGRLTNGLIIGKFMRGRTDKPMLIDQKTIRGRLGFEPNNPFYQAVQDALDTGIPSVWVLRVTSVGWQWASGVGWQWASGDVVQWASSANVELSA
jgi:hypothetical protein